MTPLVTTKPKAYTESVSSVYVNEDCSKYPEKLTTFGLMGDTKNLVLLLIDCAMWSNKTIVMDLHVSSIAKYKRARAARLMLYAVQTLKERYPAHTLEWRIFSEQDTTN